MKVKILLGFILLAIILNIISLESKAQAYREGRSYVQGAFGYGNLIQLSFLSFDNYDDISSNIIWPMFLKYEYAIDNKMGVGVNFAYASARLKYKDYMRTVPSGDIFKETINWDSYSILVRFNVHFGGHEKIDPYWGAGMGYRIAHWDYDNNDPSYSRRVLGFSTSGLFPFGFETTFGCRFMFAESFGLYTEVGIAKAIYQFGLVGSF